ncbi:c-type cytochrome, partial [Burkholderia pseudomallei]
NSPNLAGQYAAVIYKQLKDFQTGARKKKEALAAQGAGPKNTEGVSAAVQAQIDAAEARRRRLAEQRDAAGEPGRPDDANAAGDDASPPSKTKQ